MALLLFGLIYGYSWCKRPGYLGTATQFETNELKLASRLQSLVVYDRWIKLLMKKGFLTRIRQDCLQTPLLHEMNSGECATILLIFFTAMVAACLELSMILLDVGWTLLSFGAALLLAVWLATKMVEELFSRIRKVRQRNISQQLPVFLTKLMLLMGAGVSVQSAWKSALGSEQEGFFYRCGWTVVRDLEMNGSLQLALEHLSVQTSDYRVARLVKLLVQMRDYGDPIFLTRLEALKVELWQDRIRIAREMAEEAKVKLLIPLFVIFGGIMLIIMIPILLAMRGVYR